MNPISVHKDKSNNYYAKYKDGTFMWLEPEEVEPTMMTCKQKEPLPYPEKKTRDSR